MNKWLKKDNKIEVDWREINWRMSLVVNVETYVEFPKQINFVIKDIPQSIKINTCYFCNKQLS